MDEPLADIIHEGTDTIRNFRSQISLRDTFRNYVNAVILASPTIIASAVALSQDITSLPVLGAAFITATVAGTSSIWKYPFQFTHRNAPEKINQSLRKISESANIDHPAFVQISRIKNSGYDPFLNRVILDKKLLDLSLEPGMRVEYSHELGHKVMQSSSFSAPRKAYMLSGIFAFSALFLSGQEHNLEDALFNLSIASQFALIGIMSLFQAGAIPNKAAKARLHRNEYFCDEFAARVLKDKELVISRLKEHQREFAKKKKIEKDEATHPSFDNRIKRLEALKL